MDRIAKFEKISKGQYILDCPSDDTVLVEAIYDSIELPQRATRGSAGYDFYAPYEFTLDPGETIKVPTGIRAKMDDGWVLMIFPRSGLGFKYRLRLDNTVGIIDADYYYSENEGHIMIKLTNCGNKSFTIEEGQAFAQGVFLPFGITEDDNTTDVRNGGFGSTDKK